MPSDDLDDETVKEESDPLIYPYGPYEYKTLGGRWLGQRRLAIDAGFKFETFEIAPPDLIEHVQLLLRSFNSYNNTARPSPQITLPFKIAHTHLKTTTFHTIGYQYLSLDRKTKVLTLKILGPADYITSSYISSFIDFLLELMQDIYISQLNIFASLPNDFFLPGSIIRRLSSGQSVIILDIKSSLDRTIDQSKEFVKLFVPYTMDSVKYLITPTCVADPPLKAILLRDENNIILAMVSFKQSSTYECFAYLGTTYFSARLPIKHIYDLFKMLDKFGLCFILNPDKPMHYLYENYKNSASIENHPTIQAENVVTSYTRKRGLTI